MEKERVIRQKEADTTEVNPINTGLTQLTEKAKSLSPLFEGEQFSTA
jgi:hypothetical protein